MQTHTQDQPIRKDDSRIGQLLGNWRIDSLMGHGGIAAVYSATHQTNGRRVAIKVLHREHVESRTAAERLLQEGYITNQVRHPGVVEALDDGTTSDGCAYLVLELLEGEDLDQRSERPISPAEILSITDKVLDTLAAAHDAGIVHRDIKPDNIFLARDGGVKLLDFGIARANHARRRAMTAIGSTIGTPEYMPPEQASGQPGAVEARSDIWSLGATLFRLFTGTYVREGNDPHDLLRQAVSTPVPSLGQRSALTGSIVRLVDRALAFRVEDRWRDARQMQEAVRWALSELKGPSVAPHAAPTLFMSEFGSTAIAPAVNESGSASGTGNSERSPTNLQVKPPSTNQNVAHAFAAPGTAALPEHTAINRSDSNTPPGDSYAPVYSATDPTSAASKIKGRRWAWVALAACVLAAVPTTLWLTNRPAGGTALANPDQDVATEAVKTAAATDNLGGAELTPNAQASDEPEVVNQAERAIGAARPEASVENAQRLEAKTDKPQVRKPPPGVRAQTDATQQASSTPPSANVTPSKKPSRNSQKERNKRTRSSSQTRAAESPVNHDPLSRRK